MCPSYSIGTEVFCDRSGMTLIDCHQFSHVNSLLLLVKLQPMHHSAFSDDRLILHLRGSSVRSSRQVNAVHSE